MLAALATGPSAPAMPPPAPPTELVPSERVVVLLSCALSALGSGLLVATHALWPDLRSRARQLLLFLSLADLLSAASYFYGVLQDFEGPSWDCVLQGALSTFANTSSFFWTVAVALYLYLSIVRASRGPRDGRLLWAFHVVRWVVAAALLSSRSRSLGGPPLCSSRPSSTRILVGPARRVAGSGRSCLTPPTPGRPGPAGRCQACPRDRRVPRLTAQGALCACPKPSLSAMWVPRCNPLVGAGARAHPQSPCLVTGSAWRTGRGHLTPFAS